METVLGPASLQMYKRPTALQVEGNFRKTQTSVNYRIQNSFFIL